MLRSRKLVLVAGVIAASVAGGGAALAADGGHEDAGKDQGNDAVSEVQYTKAHLADAAVSQADAERAAQAVHAGATFDTHLQDEGDGLRWETKIDDHGTVREIQVDAQTGSVVSDQPDE